MCFQESCGAVLGLGVDGYVLPLVRVVAVVPVGQVEQWPRDGAVTPDQRPVVVVRRLEHGLLCFGELVGPVGNVEGVEAASELDAVALDVAATQFADGGRYVLRSENRTVDRDTWIETIARWCREHPIVAVEDPLHEDDVDGHRAVRAAVGPGVIVVGDDLLVTDPQRIDDRAGAADALLLKPNQAGTLTTARRAVERARARTMRIVASARSGETEDVTLAHLAVGWGADLVKVGSVTRGERTAKWNELLRIEEHIPEFVGWAALATARLDGPRLGRGSAVPGAVGDRVEAGE